MTVQALVLQQGAPDRLIRDLGLAPLVDEADVDRYDYRAATIGLALTEREIQVLRALGDGGLTQNETATVLGCSLETVKSHVKGAKAKTRSKTTAQAIARAIRAGTI